MRPNEKLLIAKPVEDVSQQRSKRRSEGGRKTSVPKNIAGFPVDNHMAVPVLLLSQPGPDTTVAQGLVVGQIYALRRGFDAWTGDQNSLAGTTAYNYVHVNDFTMLTIQTDQAEFINGTIIMSKQGLAAFRALAVPDHAGRKEDELEEYEVLQTNITCLVPPDMLLAHPVNVCAKVTWKDNYKFTRGNMVVVGHLEHQ